MMIKGKLKVVHISTWCNSGAGRSAYRIHEALIENGVESSFLCVDAHAHPQLKSLHTIKKHEPTFVDWQLHKIKSFAYNRLRINLFSRREKLEKKLAQIYPSLNCEIATLPFSAYNVFESPVVK